ncbi:MAG: triacylglycerol lipase [Lachnospiraceae bacterium]|nr:triacylglycerol lipase [Lachnospiraceae bacterium]
MIFLPHIILLLQLLRVIAYDLCYGWDFKDGKYLLYTCFSILLIFVYVVVLCCLHIMPYRDKNQVSLRLKIMKGATRIFRLCFWGILVQPFLYFFRLYGYALVLFSGSGIYTVLFDAVIAFFFYYFLILNGCIRILCTCRSLGVWKRVVCVFFLWMPLVNLILARYLSKRAKIEYDAEVYRFENRRIRADSEVCATKYPIILLHGIGFRDLQYFNYWGRIPTELARNGAILYYGHQQAWGTIEDNALIIKDTIKKVLLENQCDKVNIIAHSKGGLDARYLISGLHMENQVASLTTISTPHRGSELLNILNKLPDPVYRLVASFFDSSYRILGDSTPDCYHASKQLSSEFCETFNETYKDSPRVYYQSYASYVKHTLGDNLLSIPNLLMFLAGAPKNDGLVSIESAQWGHFKKTFVSTGRRGISHGDMIDLKREDYKGFDVIEAYIQIVSELKNSGY